jgi:hypothetical protein
MASIPLTLEEPQAEERTARTPRDKPAKTKELFIG